MAAEYLACVTDRPRGRELRFDAIGVTIDAHGGGITISGRDQAGIDAETTLAVTSTTTAGGAGDGTRVLQGTGRGRGGGTSVSAQTATGGAPAGRRPSPVAV